MRLPPIPGRVKFRPGLGFRLHSHPRRGRRGVSRSHAAAKVPKRATPMATGCQPPLASEPGDQVYRASDRPLPLLLEAVERQSCGRQTAASKSSPGDELGHQRIQRPPGVPPGQLEDGRHGQRVGGVGRVGRPAGPHRARRKSGSAPRATERLSSSVRGAPILRRPSRRSLRRTRAELALGPLVQREMSELVAEVWERSPAVGAEQDGPALGKRDGCSPGGARPLVRESSRRASGTTIRRIGPGAIPRPGHSVGRRRPRGELDRRGRAAWARRPRSPARPGQPGRLGHVGSNAPEPESRIRSADCAGPHLRRRQDPAFPCTAWPRG